MSAFDRGRLKPLFLGPQAENADLFETLLVGCLRDHCFWRRNFHPEDVPWISELDRISEPYARVRADLQDRLGQLLAELKRGTPHFHRRYLGHMHTDLTIAGVLAQFAAIFYSQNNVVSEASPVTTHYEQSAVARIASMIGYGTTDEPSSWGHICSGGTVANIEALWAARSVRHMPLSLYLGIKARRMGNAADRQLADALDGLEVEYRGKSRRLGELQTVELLNLRVATAFQLRLSVLGIAKQWLVGRQGAEAGTNESEDLCKAAGRLADGLLRGFGPEELGRADVDRRLREVGLRPLSDYPWTVLVSTTRHYSAEKIVDILGLGRRQLRVFSIGTDFGLDTVATIRYLEERVARAMRDGTETELPLAIVAVMGSTEEGAVDDVPALLHGRARLRELGLELWLHADAAYGGYASSMLRSRENGELPRAAPLFFSELLDAPISEDRIVQGWACSLNRLAAMNECDSVTVDPHKMGFFPYPAGVILFRDGRSRFGMSCEAPYLFEGEQVDAFAGRYTLEGSRPGHVAAGLHLAHEVLPLDQDGHGAAVGLSFLAAREIFLRVPEEASRVNPRVRVRFLMAPQLNILNYIVCHEDVRTLADQNRLTNLIREEFSSDANPTRPIADFQFFFVTTDLPLAKYECALKSFLRDAGLNVEPAEWTKGGLKVFRSVVMHPHLVGALTRRAGRQVPMIDALAHALADTCERKVNELARRRALEVVATYRRAPRILIVEDDAQQRELIRETLARRLADFHPSFAEDESSAVNIMEAAIRSGDALDLLIADVNLKGDEHRVATKASGVATIHRYRELFGPDGRVLVLSCFRGLEESERRTIPGDDLIDKEDWLFDGERGERRLVESVVELLAQKCTPTV